MAGRENRGQKSKYHVKQHEWQGDILLLLSNLNLILPASLFHDLSSPETKFVLVIVPEVKKRVPLFLK